MKIGLRIALLLAGVAAAAAVGACSGGADRSEAKPTVSLIAKTKYGDYWGAVRSGAEVAAKEFGVHLVFQGPEDEADVAGQIGLVRQALSGGADALVVAANDDAALARALDQAELGSVPVLAIDSPIDSPNVKSFIGPDNAEAGRLAGTRLAELVGERARVAVLGPASGAGNARQREEGLLEVLKRHPGIEVAVRASGEADPQHARELVRERLAEQGPVDGIVALNAAVSVGVAQEIRELGLEGKVKIVAFDSSPQELEFIQEGAIQATVVYGPFSMGYLAVQQAADTLRGKTVPERVDPDLHLIDAGNMFSTEYQKLLFPFIK